LSRAVSSGSVVEATNTKIRKLEMMRTGIPYRMRRAM
jgi:hypothetical protein